MVYAWLGFTMRAAADAGESCHLRVCDLQACLTAAVAAVAVAVQAYAMEGIP